MCPPDCSVLLPLTILAGWAIGAELFEPFSLAEVLILAVILAPTDAALGQVVVTDPRLPSRIRQGLNVESGLNDGICVPLLFIAIALAETGLGLENDHAALVLVVEAIGYGVVFGAIAGVVGGFVSRLVRQRGLMDAPWSQILPIATAGLAYGLAAPTWAAAGSSRRSSPASLSGSSIVTVRESRGTYSTSWEF